MKILYGKKEHEKKERIKKGATMKSRMNKLMSLCLVAMMSTTFIPQPIQAEEVSEFEEESFEEATVEYEEATFEEEKNQVAESSRKTPVVDTFDDRELRYQVTGADTVEVIGFADGYQPTGYELWIPETVSKHGESDKEYAVTSIGDNAFKGGIPNNIQLIDLPRNLITIGESAFEGCTSLKDFNLPESLKTIGKRAFFGCYNLKEVYFSPFKSWVLETIGESAFEGCTWLMQITLPHSLKAIGESAFKGCTSLNDLCLRDGLEIIGESAFEGCTSLYELTLPPNLKTIDKRTFFGCDHLEVINNYYTLECEMIGESAFEGCTSLRELDLFAYDGLKTIGESAFKNCSRLEKIYLPEGLETIGESAFDLLDYYGFYLPRLREINIPSTVKELNHIFGKNSDNHTVISPFSYQSALVFRGDELPKIDSDFFNLLSSGKNKPIIYFPENAMEAYAGEKSPFVEAGLINPEFFDSFYESIQLCPKNGKNDWNSDVTIPRLTDFYLAQSLDYDYNHEILDVLNNSVISSKGLTGETIFSYRSRSSVNGNVIYLTSEANKIKFKVAHRYVWVVEKEPTKDEPGSKYQYCVKCEDAKAPVTIPPTGGGSGGGSTGGGSGGGSTGGSGGSSTDSNAPTQQVENAVYRAYNPYNGEHLYTTNYGEFKVITKNGWNDEGIAFMSESKEKGQAVYRVYNPNSGLHHYTTNVNE